ncbi:FRG domain-containing protein [Enterobacter sp. MW07]|nr:FRG domain-containing protein [Enterobacter sp. MW07]
MITECKHFLSANDFLNFLCSWNNDLRGYVFRGHSREEYELLPSILREDKRYLADSQYPRIKDGERRNSNFEWSQIQTEYIMLREFYKLSDKHGLKVPNAERLRDSLLAKYDLTFSLSMNGAHDWIPSYLLETTALAQHYGIPTRLLDWSYDPFISAYFAASGVNQDEGNLAIWCFNAESISLHSNLNKDFPFKVVTPPYSDNVNLAAQKGLFTHIPTKFNFTSENASQIKVDRTPLDLKLDKLLPSLYQNKEKIFIKITLPCSEAKHLKEKLVQHGYGEARIYPGYTGIANQVMSNYNK